MSTSLYKRVYGEMSEAQNQILEDDKSPYILVTAGPGSGKTRVLVHKLASMLLAEDTKPEHLLMLSFSRAAANEFKLRLLDLIGKAAYGVEIRTFHSYCFELLGRPGKLDADDKQGQSIVQEAYQALQTGQIEASTFHKMVLVIDEAQDMAAEDWNLVMELDKQNEEMRIILVGDDDQNIYAFRNSDSRFMASILEKKGAQHYELVRNYRSCAQIIALSNAWISQLKHRLKAKPIEAHTSEAGICNWTEYAQPFFMRGLAEQLKFWCEKDSEKGKSFALLCQTNHEAIVFFSLLTRLKLNPKLIQQNSGYRLHKLQEMQAFLNFIRTRLKENTYIDSALWEEAKNYLQTDFERKDSITYPMCLEMLATFEKINKSHRYFSDLEQFIFESAPEDFAQAQGDTIWISTIHKAKGKEFDHVFIYLEGLDERQYAEEVRKLYVALTRAKYGLHLHSSQKIKQLAKVWPNWESQKDEEAYEEESSIMLSLELTDVYLDFSCTSARQSRLQHLRSGDLIDFEFEPDYYNDKYLFNFSKKFSEKLETWFEKFYVIKRVRIRALVWWYSEKKGKEFLIPLVDLALKKELMPL